MMKQDCSVTLTKALKYSLELALKYSLELLCLLGFSYQRGETALCKFAVGKDNSNKAANFNRSSVKKELLTKW